LGQWITRSNISPRQQLPKVQPVVTHAIDCARPGDIGTRLQTRQGSVVSRDDWVAMFPADPGLNGAGGIAFPPTTG
jgi:hypothetical protein